MGSFKPISMEKDMGERVAFFLAATASILVPRDGEGPEEGFERIGRDLARVALNIFSSLQELEADAGVLLERVHENNPLFSTDLGLEIDPSLEKQVEDELRALGREV